MQNIVGQIPRRENFYPRDTVINRIYRRLDSGNHLYLSAPRRSGKTSIMYALGDSPREGYIFIYLNVEDCNDKEYYFRLLSEELEKSAANGRLARLGERAKGVLESFLDRVKKVKISILELETASSALKPSYAETFEQLLRDLETENTTIVIMVDEFPVAVENIAKTQGKDAAVAFLHANRAMRQRAQSGIRFVYTGSIGLPNVARKLDPSPTINDLNIVEIPPLSTDEALDMSRKIFAGYKIVVDEAILYYMLEKIQWLMPFFIQLVIQLLIDESESDKAPINANLVDTVLLMAANHRNNAYFASYHDRLDRMGASKRSALSILAKLAKQGQVEISELRLAKAQSVLEILEYDGYIYEQNGKFRFSSPILRMWWQKNV